LIEFWAWFKKVTVQKGDSHLLPERPEGCFAQKVAVTFLNHAEFCPCGGELPL
jgi:hypothetical protein